MSLTIVTQVQRVVVRGSGATYSDAKVRAYLRTILTTNGDLLTVADGALARIAVGGASAGSLLTWNGSAWTVAAPAAVTVAWDDITGKPSTFPPSSHNHVASEITDFATAWTARLTAAGSGATTGNALIWGGSSWAPGAYAYANLSGIPSTFTPAAHNHVVADVTDFNTGWTARLTALGSGATTNDVLTWDGSTWAAATPSTGFSDPLTTNGDVIGRVLGVTTRVALGIPQAALSNRAGALAYELHRPVALYSAVANAVGEWTSVSLQGTTSGGTTVDSYGTFRQRSGANVATGVIIAGNVATELNRDIELVFMLDTALPTASGTIWVGAGGSAPTSLGGGYRAQIQWSGSGNYLARFASASSSGTTDLGFAPTLDQLVRVVIRMRRTFVAIQCFDAETGAALSPEVTEATDTPIGITTVFGAFALLNSGSAGTTSGIRLYVGQTRVLG